MPACGNIPAMAALATHRQGAGAARRQEGGTTQVHGPQGSKTRALTLAAVASPVRAGVTTFRCAKNQQAPVLGALGRLSRRLGLGLLGALRLVLPGVLVVPVLAGLAWPVAAAPRVPACPGPALDFRPLAPGLWWVPGAPGDADADNRGQVSNLVLAPLGRRVWLLGSGPTPAFGRALACQVQRRWGRPVSDLISPWPHPELVLGAAGLGPVRHWAHADVADAMAQRCPTCVGRLRLQLGPAADDLGDDPVRVPGQLLQGDQGRLGPWRWWRLSRGSGFPVTVWQHGQTSVRFAPGLLWGEGAPDGRDAELQVLAASSLALDHLPGALRAEGLQWLGEQGPPAADLPQRHQRYWAALQQAVQAAQDRGDLEAAPAPSLLQVPASDPRHALNWQRAWRQLEAGEFQRSLR